ncbi:entericidin A/B family lipoprotein [Thalassobaculum sp.]|uniref:entericidin A/B family lipoprotein n=1 Tax=Thalassobaculum sp. TaxID=2022740 RepID=UPI0032EB3528
MSIMRFAPWIVAGLLAVGGAGCENTVRGFGQDMQKTGKAIEKATGTSGGSSSQPAGSAPARAPAASPSPSAAPAAPTPLKTQ